MVSGRRNLEALKGLAEHYRKSIGADTLSYAFDDTSCYVRAHFADLQRENVAKVKREGHSMAEALETGCIGLKDWHDRKLAEWGGPKPGGENDPPVTAGVDLAWMTA